MPTDSCVVNRTLQWFTPHNNTLSFNFRKRFVASFTTLKIEVDQFLSVAT